MLPERPLDAIRWHRADIPKLQDWLVMTVIPDIMAISFSPEQPKVPKTGN